MVYCVANVSADLAVSRSILVTYTVVYEKVAVNF